MNITNADDEIIESDGAGLLDENANGSESSQDGRIEIGTIGDNIETTAVVSYRLAEDGDNNNDQFQIDDGKLYYIGTNSGDFENTDKLMLDIIRTFNNNDQTLTYIVNLKDVAPDITANEADGTTEVGYIAGGTVIEIMDSDESVTYSIAYKMALSNPNLAEGETLTIEFVSGEDYKVKILPQYDANDNTKLIGFQISVGGAVTYRNIEAVLTDTAKTNFYNAGKIVGNDQDADAQANFNIWLDYVKAVTLTSENPNRTPTTNGLTALTTAGPVTLTARATIEVDEGTSGTIANFNSDGRFSLSGTDAETFTIDEATGKLSFKNAPDYETPADADKNNFYVLTITADDGTNSDTYDLLVVVADVAE